MTILLALIAATLFALGTVLQQRIAMTADDETAHSPWFMLRLARHPTWLLGFGLGLVGFGFHAAALSDGELVVVTPILSMTMVFALPLGAWLSNQRITRRDVVASIALTAALTAFLLVSHPAEGVDEPTAAAWLLGAGAAFGIAAGLIAAGLTRRAATKAALVGLAAGVLFGFHGALMKGAVIQFDNGILGPFESWQLYAVGISGLVMMTVANISLQAGDLPPAIAAQSIAAPVVGIALGITIFEETLHETAGGAVLSLVAIAVMCAGIWALAQPRDVRLD